MAGSIRSTLWMYGWGHGAGKGAGEHTSASCLTSELSRKVMGERPVESKDKHHNMDLAPPTSAAPDVHQRWAAHHTSCLRGKGVGVGWPHTRKGPLGRNRRHAATHMGTEAGRRTDTLTRPTRTLCMSCDSDLPPLLAIPVHGGGGGGGGGMGQDRALKEESGKR